VRVEMAWCEILVDAHPDAKRDANGCITNSRDYEPHVKAYHAVSNYMEWTSGRSARRVGPDWFTG